jgi:hypothetical protein
MVPVRPSLGLTIGWAKSKPVVETVRPCNTKRYLRSTEYIVRNSDLQDWIFTAFFSRCFKCGQRWKPRAKIVGKLGKLSS